MNEWKFYNTVLSECKKRNENWNNSTAKVKERQFNAIYEELSADEDIVLTCIL
jgi:hypothetical protein